MKFAVCTLFVALAACGSPPESAAPAAPPAQETKPVETTTTGAASSNVPTPPADDKIPPSKIAARHVLIQYMGAERVKDTVVRTKDQARSMAEEVWKRAKAGEDFARLAVEYSDEPNAAQRGGSLGRFGKGVMAPQFEDAAFHLKVGEVSGVVETTFGFHVIQRTE